MAELASGVPPWWRPYVEAFLARARYTAQLSGASATSYIRSPEKNRLVGGSDSSQHLVGTAVDFVGPDFPRIMAAAARAGLVAINERDHVHVQLFPAGVIPRDVIRYLASLP